MSRFFFLVNPLSGGAYARKMRARLEVFAAEHPEQLRVEALSYPKLEEQLERASTFDILVLAGGDGTFSSIIPRVVSSQPIGLIPFGTGNDLVRELYGKAQSQFDDVEDMLRMFSQARSVPLTIWEFEFGASKHTFLNYLSLGFDAAVVSDFSRFRSSQGQKLKSVLLNRLMYAVFGMRHALLRRHRVQGELFSPGATERVVGEGIIFANITSMMGLGRSNTASVFHDERLEALEVRSFFDYANMLLGHSISFLGPRLIGSEQSWRFVASKPVQHIQYDGETLDGCNEQEIRIYSKGIASVLIPKS